MSRKNEIEELGFSVEKHYQFYLEKIQMSEEKMHPLQRAQIRQAWFGGFGQALLLLRDGISQIKDEQKAIKIFKDLLNQVSNSFLNQN